MRSCWKIVAVLTAAAALSGLGLAGGAPNNTTTSTPAHVARLGADGWHAAGHKGQGVKVVVLDTDFAGFRAQLGKTLPKAVKGRSFRRDGDLEARGSGHGLRTAQIIHAVAPRAELYLANWDSGQFSTFLDALKWAKSQGARIISCSVTTPTWGDGEGGGPHHEQLARALGKGDAAGDLLYVSSAGNVARGHWAGSFRRGAGGHHEWAKGVIDNLLTPITTRRVRVTLVHKPGAAYELLVYEGDDDEPKYRRKSNANSPLPSPRLAFTAPAGATYRVRVKALAGRPGPFHLLTRDSWLDERNLKGSVCSFPADNPLVLTVGAVDKEGERTAYSPVGPAAGRRKPELVAPVPFLAGGESFAGTSAAAPQVAGVAALLAGKHRAWTARRLRDELLKQAQRPGPRPTDQTGYGRVALPGLER